MPCFVWRFQMRTKLGYYAIRKTTQLTPIKPFTTQIKALP